MAVGDLFSGLIVTVGGRISRVTADADPITGLAQATGYDYDVGSFTVTDAFVTANLLTPTAGPGPHTPWLTTGGTPFMCAFNPAIGRLMFIEWFKTTGGFFIAAGLDVNNVLRGVADLGVGLYIIRAP